MNQRTKDTEEHVTSDGRLLIKDWLGAQRCVEAHERALLVAKNELASTTAALAKWILPPDAINGETISIWVGDSIISATKWETPHVHIRTSGRSIQLL